MANKRETVYLSGKVYWAKIFGSPRPDYNGDKREWTFEFEPDDASLAVLEEHGLGDRLKDGRRQDGTMRPGYENRRKFIYLRRDEFDFEGKPNEHIRVVDAANQEWDGKLLGNETVVDVKTNIVDYGRGKKKGIYPQALRVLELVPYTSNDFAPLDESDPRVKKAKESRGTPDFHKDFDIEETSPEPQTTDSDNEAPATDDDLNDDVPLD